MSWRALAIVLLAPVLACTGERAGPTDAALVDAPIDAPAVDAPIDALAIDAPAIDAPIDALATDAPAIDAPIDAADLDAADLDAADLDAVAADGPTDASIDAIDDWAPPIMISSWFSPYGSSHCASFGSRLGWGLVITSGLSSLDVYLDGAPHDHVGSLVTPGGCSMVELPGGHLAYAMPGGLGPTVHESQTGRQTSMDGLSKVLVADPTGGLLVLRYLPYPDVRVSRIDAAFAYDPSFGGGGVVALPGDAERTIGQPPVVTFQAGDQLLRFDLRTGAPITAFGGTGTVALGVVPADLLAIAPLATDGLALIARGPGATEVTIDRIAADGTRAAPQIVDLTLPPTDAVTDRSGRVTFSFPSPDRTMRLARIDAHTGALDASFGSGGRTVVFVLPQHCPEITYGFTWQLSGALDDGTVVILGRLSCGSPVGSPPPRSMYFRVPA